MTPRSFPVPYQHPYPLSASFQSPTAYFSMEFALDQALKTYSGGLGFLAGSHMRSAYALRQGVVGIGMLWKYGYYDQVRKRDNGMEAFFREKMYYFLEDTGIRFQVNIAGKDVWVHAYYLAPEVFQTAPIFWLTTDTDGNDHEARTISYSLYDSDPSTKVAQCMVLGIGGAKLLDLLRWTPSSYHLNEAHALSAAFYLYRTLGKTEEVTRRLVFTTHTPEEAGNEKHNLYFLEKMGFFQDIPLKTIRTITGIEDDVFNHSLAALRLSRKANGVSKLHGEVARKMWGGYDRICEITHITNAQNKRYWADAVLEKGRIEGDSEAIAHRKKELKARLFETVADQTGRLMKPEVLTIVWARRFAGYKRADMLTWDRERFDKLLTHSRYPIQIIWAGKPYPKDEGAIQTFNSLVYLSHLYPNMAVLTGYELALSKLLKDGSDVWLNTPIVTHEASGTSGMTAAMNASINCSTYDGWICEFAKHGENSFILPVAEGPDVNKQDMERLFDLLENVVLPTYYDAPERWGQLVLNSMNDVAPFFDSDRMATEYYEQMYGQLINGRGSHE